MGKPASKKIKRRNEAIKKSFADNPQDYGSLSKKFDCSYSVVVAVLGGAKSNAGTHKKTRNKAIISAYRKKPQTLTKMSEAIGCSSDVIGHQLRLAGIRHADYKADLYKTIGARHERKAETIEELCKFFDCKPLLIKKAFKYLNIGQLPLTNIMKARKKIHNNICKDYTGEADLSLVELALKYELNESTIYRILIKNDITTKKNMD